MKICDCGQEIPKSKVLDGKRRNLKNRSKCLNCQPFGQHKYRQKSPEEIRSKLAEKARRHYQKHKAKHGIDPVKSLRDGRRLDIITAIGGGCQICGYSRCIRNLAFHHLRDKQFELSSRGFQYQLETMLSEIRKCVLVCHNCHGEIHSDMINMADLEPLNLILVNNLIAYPHARGS